MLKKCARGPRHLSSGPIFTRLYVAEADDRLTVRPVCDKSTDRRQNRRFRRRLLQKIKAPVLMPHYLIHIGPHKTGTTYLQHSFTHLRRELAVRKICYPDRWGGPHGHHRLAIDIQSGNTGATKLEFERLNRSDSKVILLSSETFSYFSDRDVRQLHTLLSGEKATVVFYCRRWSELIPSTWREMVKHGSRSTLPEVAFSCFRDPEKSDIVNFDLVLNRYASVFGIKNLRIGSYSAVLDDVEDLLVHFCRNFLDWEDPPSTGFGRVNVSLDLVDTEIIRALNALDWIRAGDDRKPLYHRFVAEKAKFPIAALIEQAMQYVVDTTLIDDAIFAKLHARIARRYRQAMVPPYPVAGLFVPRVAKILYVRSDYQLFNGVIEMLRRMHVHLLHVGE